MRFTSLLILLVILASCGTDTPIIEDAQEVGKQAIEETAEAVTSELENISKGAPIEELDSTNSDTDAEPTPEAKAKVSKVKVIYTNPKQEVFIDLVYSIDGDGKIESIMATDTNYKKEVELPKLNENLQVLLGKSLNEVGDTYISGGSLTIPAVKNTLTESA